MHTTCLSRRPPVDCYTLGESVHPSHPQIAKIAEAVRDTLFPFSTERHAQLSKGMEKGQMLEGRDRDMG